MERTEQSSVLPLPLLEGFAEEFYSWCRRGSLHFQRCSTCGKWRHIPRERCDACLSDAWEWSASSGRGHVFSFTTVHRALSPGLEDRVPFLCAVIAMDEGVRLIADVDADLEAVDIGTPVEAYYVEVAEGFTLPRFRPLALPETPEKTRRTRKVPT